MREEFPLFRVTHTLANTIKVSGESTKIFAKFKQYGSDTKPIPALLWQILWLKEFRFLVSLSIAF